MKKTRLEFRPVALPFLDDLDSFFGAPATWPDWIRNLAGKSGVYVIRNAGNGRIRYVGESHTGRLKKTLLRHFQAWSGKTAGQKYSRGEVEIAVIPTDKSRAVTLQNDLIAQLSPTDNTISPAGPIDPPDDDPF